MLRKIFLQCLVSGLGLLFLIQCSSEGDYLNEGKPPFSFNKENKIQIPFKLLNIKQELNLTATDHYDFKMRLSNCDSGYEIEDIPSDSESIEVYLGDEDCRVELYDISVEDLSFNVVSAFTDYQLGDTGSFSHPEDDSNVVHVEVMSQLSSPIQLEDIVTYHFKQVDKREEIEVDSRVLKTDSFITLDGVEAPQYMLMAVQLEAAERREAPISFYFDCLEEGVADVEDFLCHDQKYSEIMFKFLKYPEAPEGLSLADLNEIFSEGALSAPEHGEVTENGFTLELTATLGDIHNHKKFILVLKNAEGSYSYYSLEVK